jgi:hypothetical protein
MERYCTDLQNEPLFVGKLQTVLPKITKNKTNKKWSFSNVNFLFAAGLRGSKL